jgi:adenylate kinase
VLDGFPRTHAQAEALDAEMKSLGGVDRVVFIKVSKDELIRRLTGRLICRNCQTPYHLLFSPPATKGMCDKCGGELYQRDDDQADVVTTRIQIYNQETEPVVDYYRRSSILREVDGEQAVEDVGNAMNAAITG